MSWFLEYNLGWDSGANKAAIKGTVVHHVLELLAVLKKADQNNKLSIGGKDVERLGWKRLFTRNYLGTDKNIDKLSDRVYDFYQPKYEQLKWVDKDKEDCRKWSHKLLGGEFDPRTRDIFEAEYFFDIEIVKPWSAYNYTLPDGRELKGFFSIKGTIDLTTFKEDAVEIVDFKTGQYRKDWNTGKEKDIDDIKNDIQPRMYHYVMSKRFPGKQIIVTMLYMNAGGAFSVYYDDSDIDKTEKLLETYWKKIKAAQPSCVKSWRCKKFCNYGKTTFENTSIKPITHNWTLSKCQQLEYILQYKSTEQVLGNMCCGDLVKNLDRYSQG